MPDAVERSRDSVAGAGWECEAGAAYAEKSGPTFSWLDPRPLWRSRNDRLARLLGDPTDDRRRAWMKQLGRNDAAELLIDSSRADGTASFLVLGDTGEGDESQKAVVRPLLSQAEGTDFMFICSDVVYPAGGATEYGPKFFEPYERYPAPIYAVPGNHDWYDDGTGFMRWFCGAEEAPRQAPVGHSPKLLLRRMLWRRPSDGDAAELRRLAALWAGPVQPAPYFAIDTGPLLLIGIDTGIVGNIDRDQARWLKRVSRESPKPKILLSGKPIYVDGQYRPGAIEDSSETVDGIVTDPAHNYVAAIGGDIHNYQRYPVGLEDGRTILYLVSGGGGAFMHGTHTIPNLSSTPVGDRVGEADFRCYPLRGDSLSLYSKLYARKWLGRRLGARFIPPDQAAAVLAERLEIDPTRGSAAVTTATPEARRAAEKLMGLPGKGRRSLHIPFSEWLDWNEAPLFKSFLRLDAADGAIRVRCFGATGCANQDDDPPLEDDLRWTATDRAWDWGS